MSGTRSIPVAPGPEVHQSFSPKLQAQAANPVGSPSAEWESFYGSGEPLSDVAKFENYIPDLAEFVKDFY